MNHHLVRNKVSGVALHARPKKANTHRATHVTHVEHAFDNVRIGAIEEGLSKAHEEQLLGADLSDPHAKRDEDGTSTEERRDERREIQHDAIQRAVEHPEVEAVDQNGPLHHQHGDEDGVANGGEAVAWGNGEFGATGAQHRGKRREPLVVEKGGEMTQGARERPGVP